MMMMVISWWCAFFLINGLLFLFSERFCDVLFLCDWNDQSAEDVIAEQAKQEEEDPFFNLTKKEKKKKKKQVNALYGAHERRHSPSRKKTECGGLHTRGVSKSFIDLSIKKSGSFDDAVRCSPIYQGRTSHT